MLRHHHHNGRPCTGLRRRTITGAMLALALLVPPLVPAQEEVAAGSDIRYVKDVIYINLRAGPAPQDKTLAIIPSGVRMEVLERNKAQGTVRVRLLSGKHAGKEGWVLARFLSREPIARDQLEAALEKVAALEGKTTTLAQELQQLRQARQEQDRELKRLRDEKQALQRELKEIKEISASAVEAHRQRQLMEQRLAEQSERLQAAEEASATAKERLYIVVVSAALLALAVGFYIGYTPIRREKRWRKLP